MKKVLSILLAAMLLLGIVPALAETDTITVMVPPVTGTYLTDIETYVKEMHIKYITGSESLDTFDSYLSTLKSMGIEDLLEIKQAQYDRYSGK